MALNPLQNYFRQPKIYLKLPTLGKYSSPGIVSGNVENLPIYGMTGMDQIISKTPDALLNGESTVKIVQSCCPSIINAWDITNMDMDGLLVAIRIATYGNTMKIDSTCSHCATENTYELDISHILTHYSNFKFESSVVVDDLVIRLIPLTYKQITEFSLENFSLQKQLSQVVDIIDENKKQDTLLRIYTEFAILKNKVLVANIDQVETPDGVVSEYGHIREWIDNCDKNIPEAIRDAIDINNDKWKLPPSNVVCDNCGGTHLVSIDLDYSNFFDPA